MIRGPWYITVRAVRDYLRLTGQPDVTDGPVFDRAAAEIGEIAAKLDAKGPTPQVTESGARIYREGRPRCWRYTVKPAPRAEGSSPQLVRISR